MTDIFDDYHFCDWFTNLKVRGIKGKGDKRSKKKNILVVIFILLTISINTYLVQSMHLLSAIEMS